VKWEATKKALTEVSKKGVEEQSAQRLELDKIQSALAAVTGRVEGGVSEKTAELEQRLAVHTAEAEGRFAALMQAQEALEAEQERARKFDVEARDKRCVRRRGDGTSGARARDV
jgi:hypothetical protein